MSFGAYGVVAGRAAAQRSANGVGPKREVGPAKCLQDSSTFKIYKSNYWMCWKHRELTT